MELDSVTLEVLSRKLAAITDEMYFSVQRASRSSYVKEAADFAVALLDVNGEVFAYPPSATFAFLIDTEFKSTIDALCCANIAPLAACQLVESSTDPDGGWHTKAHHPIQRVASNLCFDPLSGQNPSVETPANGGFVPIHRGLNEASPVVARTTLPPDSTMLLMVAIC